MSLLSPTEHRTILMVDVADFTNPARDVADLSAVQNGVYEVLETAFHDSGIDYGACHSEDRGDGALILVPPAVSKSVLADRLPERLVAELIRYNSTRTPAARFKLRVGIHAGDIRRNTNGWVGPAINLTARIPEADEVKSALARSDGLLALVASDYFFSEVIEPDPGMLPERYSRIDATVKKFHGAIWLRLPGEGVPMPAIPAVAPQPPAALTREPAGDVLDVVSAADASMLQNWLSDREVPHLATLVARAVGSAIPPPRQTSAWEVFRYLADFNAGPDGVPPALAFLKLLARELGGELETWVSDWVDSQVRRMRLAPAAAERSAGWQPIPEQPHLHLMIVVEPDAIDPNLCLLSFWRQDDPLLWPPTRGDVRETTRDRLEYEVDEIVVDAERAWAGQPVSVMVEFVLARSMLTLPVYQWCKEHRSGDPRPLALDYRLGLRSLERMRATYWHRQWKMRWKTATNHPHLDRIHPFGPTNATARIDAVLSDPHYVGLVMEQPPAPRSEPDGGPDALTAALRAGLPFICWHPTATPEDLRDHVDWLMGGEGGMIDLPERHQQALWTQPSKNSELVCGLVVMWEDPYRVIDLGQPSIPTP